MPQKTRSISPGILHRLYQDKSLLGQQVKHAFLKVHESLPARNRPYWEKILFLTLRFYQNGGRLRDYYRQEGIPMTVFSRIHTFLYQHSITHRFVQARQAVLFPKNTVKTEIRLLHRLFVLVPATLSISFSELRKTTQKLKLPPHYAINLRCALGLIGTLHLPLPAGVSIHRIATLVHVSPVRIYEAVRQFLIENESCYPSRFAVHSPKKKGASHFFSSEQTSSEFPHASPPRPHRPTKPSHLAPWSIQRQSLLLRLQTGLLPCLTVAWISKKTHRHPNTVRLWLSKLEQQHQIIRYSIGVRVGYFLPNSDGMGSNAKNNALWQLEREIHPQKMELLNAIRDMVRDNPGIEFAVIAATLDRFSPLILRDIIRVLINANEIFRFDLGSRYGYYPVDTCTLQEREVKLWDFFFRSTVQSIWTLDPHYQIPDYLQDQIRALYHLTIKDQPKTRSLPYNWLAACVILVLRSASPWIWKECNVIWTPTVRHLCIWIWMHWHQVLTNEQQKYP